MLFAPRFFLAGANTFWRSKNALSQCLNRGVQALGLHGCAHAALRRLQSVKSCHGRPFRRLSGERGKTAADAKQPGKEEIEQVLADWGKTPIDNGAILRILVPLNRRNCSYASFRPEAARRVREARPMNPIGFVIRLAESGEIYGEPEPSLKDQAAEIDSILDRQSWR